MKKTIFFSLVAALAVTLILFGIDTCGALVSSELPISYERPGGDCSVDQGIGWNILHLYPLTAVSDTYTGSTTHVNFDFLSLVIVFAALWFLMFLIICLFTKNIRLLLIIFGSILGIVLLIFIISTVKDAIGDTPTELSSIRIHTSDMHPGSCYAISYPRNVYYFVPAGKAGPYGHTQSETLYLEDDVENISKKQLKQLLNAATELKSETVLKGDKEAFAFRVEIVYKTNDGYGSLKFTGYESFPDSWAGFASEVNSICKNNYLSETPQPVRFSKEWFMESFAISEADMPPEGSLDGFIKYRKIDMETISGINSSGNEYIFDISTELDAYFKAFTRADRDALRELAAKEPQQVPSTPDEFREFAYAYTDMLGCKDKAEYSVLLDLGTDYLKFIYEMDIVYVLRSEGFTPEKGTDGLLQSPKLPGLSGNGTAPVYYDASGKYALITNSSAAKVYDVFFADGTKKDLSP